MKKFFFSLLFLIGFGEVAHAQITPPVDSLLQLANEWKKVDSLGKWLNCHKQINVIYRSEKLTDSALSILTRALENRWRPPNSATETRELAWTYANRAYLFEHQIGNFLKAKRDYEKAFQLFHQIEKHDFYVTRYVWHPLANIYTRLGENEQAINLLEKVLEHYETLHSTSNIADAYNDIGLVYINILQFQKAIESFDKGIAKNAPSYNGLIYSNKAKALLELGAFAEGISTIQNSIQLLKEDNGFLSDVFLMGAYDRYGRLLSKKGEYTNALIQFEQALTYQSVFDSPKHRKIAAIHLGIAENYLAQNQALEAMKAYQKALIQSVIEFNDTKIETNPLPTQLHAEVNLGKALIGKAKVAKVLYNQQGQIKWLLLAHQCYTLYFEWEKQLRSEYKREASKLLFTKELHQAGESAIALLFQLQELNVEGNWAEQAFQWIEQTKGILLSESMVSAIATIPELKNDSLLNELNVTQKQLQMIQISQGSLESKDSLLLQREQKELEVNIQLLETNLLEKFPSLYAFKNSSNSLTPTQPLITHLKQQQANVISYFLGDSMAFVTLIHEGEFFLKQFDRKDCRFVFNQLKSQLHSLHHQKANSYEEVAHQLYQVAVAPIVPFAKHQQWIIVPDGELNELPFEALVQKVQDQNSFKNLDYLLFHQQISYAPSVKFLLHAPLQTDTLKEYLGIAPHFKGTSFSPLKYSQREIEIGESFFGGRLLIDSSANKTAVLKEISNYRIVHLVSHAQKGKQLKEQAWIALSKEEGVSHKLYPPELISLQLSTQLLVLNACETGSGPYYEGEGTLSLAREFMLSGAQNVVTNLWQSNHEVNLELFSQFYSSLQDHHESVAFALTKAKRDYLKKQSTDNWGAHPYYWSSLVLTGNHIPLSNIDEAPSYTKEIVVIAILLLGLICLKKFKGR